ncbi:MAG TPA: VCBS repeat-containing protein [Verrucomicrobiae bacterium]|jgi:hypothetical protein
MKMITRNLFITLSLLAALHSPFSSVQAQGTAFTYQGRLNNNGAAVNGSYDMAFALYTASTSGSVYAGPVTNLAVTVSNGLFNTLVDFGSVYGGASNWLQIAVSTNGANIFTALSPRQQVTPTPYALMANSASNLLGSLSTAQLSGTIPAANISGTLSSSQLGGVYTDAVTLNNAGNSFSGNGGGLTNISLSGVGPAGTFTLMPFYFGTPISIPVPFGAAGVQLVDVNGDGLPDLIVTSPQFMGGGVFYVFTNSGSGNFILASTNTDNNGEVYSVAAGDFNGDNNVDLAAGDPVGVTVFEGFGNGTFTPVLTNTLSAWISPRFVSVVDINNDTHPDIVVGDSQMVPGLINTLLNFGAGGFTFSFAQSISVNGGITSMTMKDINGDGSPDIILSGRSLEVLTNHSGVFTMASTNPVAGGAICVAVGDVNNDGKPDLITAGNVSGPHTITIFTNLGNGILSSNTSIAVGNFPGGIVAATNSAGLVTYLAVANEGDSTMSVLANDGHGNFSTVGLENLSGFNEAYFSPLSMATADVNGDGNPDFVIADTATAVTEITGYPQVPAVQSPISMTNGENLIDGYFTGSFTGNGSALSNLNASQITSGTLSVAQLPTSVALLNSSQTFMGVNNFANANNSFTANTFSGTFFDGGHFNGNGASLTNILHATTSSATSGTVTAATIYSSETTYLSNASTITSITIALPTSTVVGQTFLIHTKSAITSLSVTGGSFADTAVTSMAVGQTVIYEAVTTTGTYIRLE